MSYRWAKNIAMCNFQAPPNHDKEDINGMQLFLSHWKECISVCCILNSKLLTRFFICIYVMHGTCPTKRCHSKL